MSELTCRDVVEFLAAYLDGELEPPQRHAFETHLAKCDDCVVYIRSYEETVRLGKSAFSKLDEPAEGSVPRGLAEAILAARRKAR